MPLRAVIFDFDGVLAESVDVKLDAYVALFSDRGADVQARVRAFVEPRLGVSRFRLIDMIYREVLNTEISPDAREQAIAAYGALVVDRVVSAPAVAGAEDFLRAQADRYRFFVVSGTPEGELHEILRRRRMDQWFEAAYGSPTPKPVLVARILEDGFEPREVVYVGDTDHDWESVRPLGIPFVWRRRSAQHRLPPGFTGPAIETLEDLPACLARIAPAPEPPAT